MIAPSRPEDEFDDDAPPDSAIQPIPVPLSSRSTAIARMQGIKGAARKVRLVVRAEDALRSGYLTVTGAESKVLFEGELVDGRAEIDVVVTDDATHVCACLEAGTKYRNAEIELSKDGTPTEHCFA